MGNSTKAINDFGTLNKTAADSTKWVVAFGAASSIIATVTGLL
jgi:hypothetical protein